MSLQVAPDTSQILHFLVQKIHLCIPLEFIVKVLPLMELKYIPNTPHYCAGLMNISGTSIPVIDLALRLHLKRVDKYTLSTSIILCSDGTHELGIIIDDILGLAHIDNNNLQLQENFNEKNCPFKGVISIDSHLALVLNMENILAFHLMTEIDNSTFDINTVNLTGFKYE
ncbi:MAG: chemotaxis protein CheW [Gammaproteobacteria bacterium]|nr:chemotaxis protein CheW [Gammaproteobacteria bacterium]